MARVLHTGLSEVLVLVHCNGKDRAVTLSVPANAKRHSITNAVANKLELPTRCRRHAPLCTQDRTLPQGRCERCGLDVFIDCRFQITKVCGRSGAASALACHMMFGTLIVFYKRLVPVTWTPKSISMTAFMSQTELRSAMLYTGHDASTPVVNANTRLVTGRTMPGRLSAPQLESRSAN
jgi:hypothetical protein